MNYKDESIYVDGENFGTLELFVPKLKRQVSENYELENHQIVPRERVDPKKLKKRGQREIYDVVKKHFHNKSKKKVPLLLLVTGKGGTGKSMTIHSLKDLLGEKVKVTATCGLAAFAIGGQTLDSLINCCEERPFKSKKIETLQEELKNVEYIIIDEMSMFGSKKLCRLNLRLQQIFPQSDELFGGRSIILVGDFGQLPPIFDHEMWKRKYGKETMVGHNWYRCFKKHINLDVVLRQDDPEFLQLLDRIYDGKITKDDWKTLLTRNPQLLHLPHNYDDIVRLFATNKPKTQYNILKLNEFKERNIPIAKIVAEHYGNDDAKTTKAKEMWGLEVQEYYCQGAKVMLIKNLIPAKYGLVNGSIGTVIDIIFREGQGTPSLPLAIITEFKDYKGPPIFKNHPKYVPIAPITATKKVKIPTKRTQVPLTLCWGMTIHKSQGLTLEAAIVDLGKSENNNGGLTYVALSRVKTFGGLFLLPKKWSRYAQINGKEMIKQRIKEQVRLNKLPRK